VAFSQTTIQDVAVTRADAELAVSWFASDPEGTWYQVYVDRVLSWHGTRRRCVVPFPHHTGSQSLRIEVGSVLPSEAGQDFSASLPTPPGGGMRFTLGWQGGAFLGADIAGFHIYTGLTPGGAVNYAEPVDTVTAYPQGLVNDGFGMGGFGSGGYGSAGGDYSWTSEPVSPGTWNYAVRSFDAAGNESSSVTGSVTVAGPPRPPARNASGRRLTYTLNRTAAGGFGTGGFGSGGFGTGAGFGAGGFGDGGFGAGAGEGLPYVTLSWLASPAY
jgi:hypothetical protein